MHPLEALEFPTRIAKRAQYEAFDFSLIDGDIQVRNCSHLDPAEHEYIVTVDDGVPTACDCPADSRFEGACKHRVAVAIRPAVLETALQYQAGTLAADGGVPRIGDAQSGTAEESSDEECEDCIGDFPCWECYRTGRKPFPE